MSHYGSILSICLIDKKGNEKLLGESYQKMHTDLYQKKDSDYCSKVDFEWFYYHKECKGMKVENISKLVQEKLEALKKFGYFEAEAKSLEAKSIHNQ